ncbi:hypothetical protein [Dysgonomonas sp. 25]|uniref:hypothetical protein n=1 Tax=Dysgonomonas sp. 25 TaxID=2302933 RepID=UPI0013D42068|nr:hypothetical protein [Dysgonomonas sp. 25]NDV68575.1 hypothetical protein [Dysgonomonas sp. 25]
MENQDKLKELSIRERLILFLKLIGESHKGFYEKTNLSKSFLLQKKSCINSDNLNLISKVYPEISLEWLITGHGYHKNLLFHNTNMRVKLKGEEEVAEISANELTEIIKYLSLALGNIQMYSQNQTSEITVLRKNKEELQKCVEKLREEKEKSECSD